MSAERRNVPAIVAAATSTLRRSLAVAGGAGDRGCCGRQPVVRHHLGLWGHSAVDKKRGSGPCQSPRSPSAGRRGLPASTSTAPATSILPTPLRPAGTTIGSSLGAKRDDRLVSSASTMPHSGLRSGLIMARRNLPHPPAS